MENKKILLVDDDKDLTMSTKVILESQNYTVIISHSKEDGLEKLKIEKPDLGIFDVMIGTNLEGFNLLNAVKSNPEHSHIPVIMMTGISDTLGINIRSIVEDQESFKNVILLDKPVDSSILLEEMNKLLNK